MTNTLGHNQFDSIQSIVVVEFAWSSEVRRDGRLRPSLAEPKSTVRINLCVTIHLHDPAFLSYGQPKDRNGHGILSSEWLESRQSLPHNLVSTFHD